MGLFGGTRRSFAVLPLLLLGLSVEPACYNTGDGDAPPIQQFYFPVGIKVSHGGSVLYAVNSDFDLQYNGGTLQSYDLRLIRQHALLSIVNPNDPRLPLIRPNSPPGCPDNPPVFESDGNPGRQPLGETCSPPVDSTRYFRDSGVIGAFATDLLLSPAPVDLIPQTPKVHASDPDPPAGTTHIDRLFAPVRGNATLTWASVVRDDFNAAPTPTDTKDTFAPFHVSCGQDSTGRCDHIHQVGEDINEAGNSRHITLPGEPFAFAMSEDGASIVMTHQTETESTLFSTGLSRFRNDDNEADPNHLPAINFVVEQVPIGGVGVATLPHDRDAFLGAAALPRPAFLETSNAVPEVSLLRQYADEGYLYNEGGASVARPFLDLEAAFPVTASAGGTDSRGIIIDPSPRLACKARVAPIGGTQTQQSFDDDMAACARKPARAFIANRTPAALLIGDVGTTQGIDASYNPDRLVIHTSVPLSAGPSNVYLAPIVDKDGAYALRVFIVCFDSATIFIYDPDGGVLENVIRVSPGPFALAFDPFDLNEVAQHLQVPTDPRDVDPAHPEINIKRYRFAYVASFTQSFVQLIDLDNALPNPITYEHVVFTLGLPTNPKGT